MAGSDTSTLGLTLPRAFRYVAIVETLSWLGLIVATIVKYTADAPLGVHILGPVHGVLFISYVLLGLMVATQLHWSWRTTGIVLLESILPGGGLLVARRADLRD